MAKATKRQKERKAAVGKTKGREPYLYQNHGRNFQTLTQPGSTSEKRRHNRVHGPVPVRRNWVTHPNLRACRTRSGALRLRRKWTPWSAIAPVLVSIVGHKEPWR